MIIWHGTFLRSIPSKFRGWWGSLTWDLDRWAGVHMWWCESIYIWIFLPSIVKVQYVRANLQILYLFVELLKVYQLLHSHVLFLLMHLTLALACTDRYMHLFCLVDFYDLISRIDNNNVRSRADKTIALYYAETLISRHRKIKKNGNKLLL